MPESGTARHDWDDSNLAIGLKRRDAGAVDVFLLRYRQVFFHCIAQFEADPALRDDLFQELVLAIYERLDRESFDPERGTFGTWVYRVAWCRCIDVKRRQTARAHLAAAPLESEAEAAAVGEADAGTSVDAAEIGAVVRAAMAELPPEERRLIELRFLSGWTLARVAAELGLTVETAKYRLKRATAGLRRRLVQPLAHEEVAE